MIEIILPDEKFLKPCFGVNRALKKCLNLENKREYLVYGELAHNQRLVEKVEQSGIRSVNSLSDKQNIIIRAHGITKCDKKKLKKHIDLTCPFVTAFKEKALKYEKDGFQIVIIGDKNHAEIKNVVSYLESPIVVHTKKEATELPYFNKLACMSQTTERQEMIDQIVPTLRKKAEQFQYIETRCGETKTRQETAQSLARRVDLLIVAGDTHSANANNLLKIGQTHTKAILVNSSEEISKKDLSNVRTFDKTSKNLGERIRTFDKTSKNLGERIRTFDKTSKNLGFRKIKVGIIASASTPHFVVDEIIKSIRTFDKTSKNLGGKI